MAEELGPSLLEKTKVDGSVREVVFEYKPLKIYHVKEILKNF